MQSAPATTGRVAVDGKQFAVNGERFAFRGVTYGTFRPRAEDGARFPERDDVKKDFALIVDAGFSVVRTYTEPTPDLVELADNFGLRLFAGVYWQDWRYLVGHSRREVHRLAREAREEVRLAARRLAGSPHVAALALGNEIPADVVRWLGREHVERFIAELVEVVREEDPTRLVTYANYPSTEYLSLDSLDFLTFNVFLERQEDFRRYLTRLQHLAGDRPLVLGEIGLHVGDDPNAEQRQAGLIDWQLEMALERGVAGTCLFSWTDEWWVGDAAVEDWRFGLTTEDRRPRPALEVAADWNYRTVADLNDDWPSMSVVVCAYNAEATIDECLRHTCALEYPGLEIVVVDDGSTDATAAIARRHQRARVITIAHGGLSVARNEGFRHAQGEIVAYLDSDAYPTPEWPYYLALGFDGRNVAGSGGPNVPPADDPLGAQVVARSPGGPVHVLVSDDRAEHIPGCNMAFFKYALDEVAGFDPVYEAAGDDVDLCWKILDRGWEIGFHPAALVWHHRRPGLRPYLKQQRGYGKAEALVEARHPDRFSPLGTARWRGRIYNPLVTAGGRDRIYRGPFGAAGYQSVYQSPSHGLDIAHQVGVPLSLAMLAMLPLALLSPFFLLPPVGALLLVLTLGTIDALRVTPPRTLKRGTLAFRLAVAVHHLCQPAVRWWGRWRSRQGAHTGTGKGANLTGPVRRHGRVLLMPYDRDRSQIAAGLVKLLRTHGCRVAVGTEWDDFDALVRGSFFIDGEVVTSAHPHDAVQIRVRVRPGLPRLASLAATIVVLWALGDHAAGYWLAAAAAGDVGWGVWRTGPGLRRLIISGVGK